MANINDCNKLSADILLKTKERISPSTLFRWFVLNNNVHKPYQNTLNTLVAYLNTFEVNERAKPIQGKTFFPDVYGSEFIALSLQNMEFKGFLAYLNKMPLEIENYEASCVFAGRVGQEIRNSIGLQKQLIPELIKTEQGRLYIIELFCDQDYLDGYYKEALEKYITIFPNKNKYKVLEDFIFSAHLLTISYLLLSEMDNLKKLQIEFEKITPKFLKNYEKLHPMPRLRFHLMNGIFHKILFKFHLNFENELILHFEQLITEFPAWRNIMLFELSKSAAMLEWNECLEYIAAKFNEKIAVDSMSGTSHYKMYVAEILQKFGNKQIDLFQSTSSQKQIEFSRYNNQIIRIKQTLNNLK